MAMRKPLLRAEADASGFIDPENRTIRDEYRALDVIDESAITIEEVRWVRPYANNSRSRLVTIGKSTIMLPVFVAEDLGKRVLFATGKYKGRTVLLIRSPGEGERAYLHHEKNRGTKRCINSSVLVEALLERGAQLGRYEPIKVRGGWMCERVKP